MIKRLALLLALLLLASPAFAQTQVKLWPNGTSGEIDAITDVVTVANARSMATMGITITGTFVGSMQAECSMDETNYLSPLTLTPQVGGATVTAMTSTGGWKADITVCKSVRVTPTAWTSGTATVTIETVPIPIGASVTVGSITAGAQPASDPHFIKCSDGAIANPCQVTLAGSNSVRLQDGAGNLVTSAVRGSERALSMQIVAADGSQITSFGGGTQYTEADTDSSITGTAIMFESNTGTNALSVVNNTTPLPVAIISGAGSGGTASNFGSAVPSAGTAAGFSDGTNMQAPRVFDGDSGGGTQYIVGVQPRFAASGGSVEAATGTGVANAATQRVVLSSDSPLPSGAATAAKQPALGTAGSASADVITIQGVASMTAVKVDGSAVTQPVSAASLPLPSGASTSANQATEITSLQLIDDVIFAEDAGHSTGDKGIMGFCVRKATTPTDRSAGATDGDYEPCQVDAQGRQYTNAAIYDSTGTAAMDTTAHAVKNLAVDSAGTAVPVADGGSGAASANTTRTIESTDSPVVSELQTGWTIGAVTSAASTNANNVKGSAGRVSSINLINTTGTLYYLRLYNLASTPTCSSATGFIVSLPVPADTSGSGFAMSFPNGGIAFTTGIGYCLTGGSSSTDNTSAATGIFGIISYK